MGVSGGNVHVVIKGKFEQADVTYPNGGVITYEIKMAKSKQ